jgi:hypothetical protein
LLLLLFLTWSLTSSLLLPPPQGQLGQPGLLQPQTFSCRVAGRSIVLHWPWLGGGGGGGYCKQSKLNHANLKKNSFFAYGFAAGGIRIDLTLLDGPQVELLAVQLEGHVLDLPHGGPLGHCHQRHAGQWERNELVHFALGSSVEWYCLLLNAAFYMKFYHNKLICMILSGAMMHALAFCCDENDMERARASFQNM